MRDTRTPEQWAEEARAKHRGFVRQLGAGASVADLLEAEASHAEIFNAISGLAQEKTRERQSHIPAPPAQPDDHWNQRKAWITDGKPLYGTLDTFLLAGLKALAENDQAEYSRQRDLMFKAVLTMLGPNPAGVK